MKVLIASLMSNQRISNIAKALIITILVVIDLFMIVNYWIFMIIFAVIDDFTGLRLNFAFSVRLLEISGKLLSLPHVREIISTKNSNELKND